MFDVKKMPATPGMARRLLSFSEMNGMVFDDSIVELASEGLIMPSDLADCPYELDDAGLQALQHVTDCNGRGMILESGNSRARHVALANSWLRKGPTLVLAQPKFYTQWAELIQAGFPEARISVFGNPRYNDTEFSYPKGIEFTEKPDWDADFFISSYGGVIWNEFFSERRVNQTIVEELDHQGAINYKWTDAVEGMFHEVPAPLFIQNIHNLPIETGRDNLAGLQMGMSRTVMHLANVVQNFMLAGNPMANFLQNNCYRDAEEYFARRGYKDVSPLRLLSLMGVSSHLLEGEGSITAPLTFFDDTIKNLQEQRRGQNSGLTRMVERETELAVSTGQSIEDIVRAALACDAPSQTLIGGLQSNQWATLKANHIKQIHTNLANKMTRSLFIIESPHLLRNMRLHMGASLDILGNWEGQELREAIKRFEDWSPHAHRPIRNLVITQTELVLYPELIKCANFLFVPEWPASRGSNDSLQTYAKLHGTRIVYSVLNGTFEEEVERQIH